jgi:predicted Ser/Thr protein kinase
MDPKQEATSALTAALPASTSRHTTSIPDEGRFVPGTLLGGRYRIIGLLGQGGMGEVYRATDLTLGQSVALKFLPHAAVLSDALLERFHGEVRVARQVSHPNVCRVYDIGEADGMPFISMEYVDGEDLSTLLLRIGRLPAERAVEIARRICAGLAAAHAKGVIHRDLKPQNIMMNRRGEIMIMDFGLAAIADQLSGAEARNGTPAYMSPEQLKGTEVTARSDIYALGLVLFELFTGKRPFDADSMQKLIEQQEAAQFPSMHSSAADIDPAVDKVIRRCLDPDPGKRPATALSVASGLPGGDPLAAALAAGETPSPDVVASAGKTEGLALRYSLTCLAAVIACIIAASPLKQARVAFYQTPLDNPPDVLRHKGREIAASFGYSAKPADTFLSLNQRLELLMYLNQRPAPRDWSRWLGTEAPFTTVYRESLQPMVAYPTGDVTGMNPPPMDPGMVSLELDGQGRLRDFRANPYSGAVALAEPVSPETVFRAAQLDISKFIETTPTMIPTRASDQIRAWKGPHPGIPNAEVTVEIAAWKGRITSARFAWPWMTQSRPPSVIGKIRATMFPILEWGGQVFMLVLARRNWVGQRADRRGATRLAAVKIAVAMAAWACYSHFVPNDASLTLLGNELAFAVFGGVVYFVLYLALEPALRARWPHSIITWNRVLTGRWTDAQVWAHVLIGAAAGSLMWTVDATRLALSAYANGLDTTGGLFLLTGTRQWFAGIFNRAADGLESGLFFFFFIFALRTVLKKDWIAAIVAAVIFSLLQADLANATHWQVELAAYTALFSVLTFVLLRLGLVATISAVFFLNTLNGTTLGTDLSTWYAPTGFANIALMLAIVLYALRRSFGDGPLPQLS